MSYWYRDTAVFLICLRLNIIPEFDNYVDLIYRNIKKYGPHNAKIYLVGTMCDLETERLISDQYLYEKAKSLGIPKYFLTSALDSYKYTLDALFREIVRELNPNNTSKLMLLMLHANKLAI